ncbi:MAG: trypsin-like serine protease [Bacteriovoracaceae bacterium]|nr:trypsin-like serine protease [Bacteriovoracaceae bacterium]
MSISLYAAALERELAGDRFEHVGMVFIDKRTACTVSLIKHGMLITAKHCFTHQGFASENEVLPQHLEIFFTTGSDQFEDFKVLIKQQSIEKVIFDRGENDLAYIVYDPKQTQNLVHLPEIEFYSSQVVAVGTALTLVGAQPRQLYRDIYTPSNFQKVKTIHCSRSNKQGKIPPIGRHNGYEGMLYGTNCPGWFGNSGGPFYILEEDKLVLVGVLTHTFDLLENGDVDPYTLYRDEFGDKGESTNFSAIKGWQFSICKIFRFRALDQSISCKFSRSH